MIDTDKYIVFKREDFLNQGMSTPELKDTAVIRLQDIFAASALYTYASSIRTVVEILCQRSALTASDKDEIDRLNEIADYFMDMASKAEMTAGKVPD